MVGNAGGIPKLPEINIRLSNLVVNKLDIRNGGVVQYNFEKTIDNIVVGREAQSECATTWTY